MSDFFHVRTPSSLVTAIVAETNHGVKDMIDNGGAISEAILKKTVFLYNLIKSHSFHGTIDRNAKLFFKALPLDASMKNFYPLPRTSSHADAHNSAYHCMGFMQDCTELSTQKFVPNLSAIDKYLVDLF